LLVDSFSRDDDWDPGWVGRDLFSGDPPDGVLGFHVREPAEERVARSVDDFESSPAGPSLFVEDVWDRWSSPVPATTADAGFDAADEESKYPQDQGCDQNDPEYVRGEAQPAEDGEDQQECNQRNHCVSMFGRDYRYHWLPAIVDPLTRSSALIHHLAHNVFSTNGRGVLS